MKVFLGIGGREMIKGVVVFALFPVFFACGADTHDYSTYTRLANTGKTTVTGGYPDASAWNPAGEMNDDGYYLIQSGCTLTSNPKADAPGGIWPGMEIAIQGTFEPKPGGNRVNAATTPRLALLAGGKILMSSALGHIEGDTLDIRGTAANPSLIQNSYDGIADKASYYAGLNIAFTGDEDGVVKLTYTGSQDIDVGFQRAFRAGKGFANFFGTVIVDGAYTWLRPETTATTFDIGGTLWITNGANVYVATVSPTFGSLVMADGATLKIASGKTVTITNSLQIAEGAKVAVDGMSSTSWVYDDGSNSPPEIPVFSVCGASNAAAVDRSALLSAIRAGGCSFRDSTTYGIPCLVLVESVRGDGGVDFKVSHVPVVKQLQSAGASNGPYGFDDYLEYLSDGREISESKDYYSNYNVYFKSGYVFPGRSLTIDLSGSSSRVFGFYRTQSMRAEDLRLVGKATSPSYVKMMKYSKIDTYLYGNATIYGIVNFRPWGDSCFHLNSNLFGSGDIAVTLDVYMLKTTTDPDPAGCGTLSLGGTNTAYKGRFLVGCGRAASDDEGLTNLTLQATSAASLGGELEEFTFDAVKIADTCKLKISDDAAFTAANRGWCLMDGATVEVDAGKTATMGGAVTFGGATVKSGAGALVLGGSAKFYDSANDAATETADGESLRIAAGEIGATSADALAGVSLTFAAGAGIVAMPETSGLVLSSAPAVEGDSLPVRVVLNNGAGSGTVDLLTLPSSVAFDSSKFAVARVRGYAFSAVQTRTEGDKTIYFATFGKGGVAIIIR